MSEHNPPTTPQAGLAPEALAHVRHELRTPLNAIIGYSEMLFEELEDRGLTDLQADVEKIRTSGSRLLAMIDTHLRPGHSPAEAHDGSRAKQVAEEVPEVMPADEAGTVLAIDDIPENLDLLARYLGRLGHRSLVAQDGPEGLRLALEQSPDVVLLDVMMPGMDGHEVLARLKSDPRTRDIPVLMVSALDQLDAVVRCIEAGAEDYLPKPFNPVLLRARIGACLEKKRLRDQELRHLEQIRVEQAKSEALLLNILPESIAGRLKAGESTIADKVGSVSVLFADLVGFTEYAGTHQADAVVGSLNRIFTTFDDLVAEYGLEKVKTIGDSYMVVGGLPPAEDAQLERMVSFGLRLQSELEVLRAELGVPFRLRVGIHCGPVVAGVIGKRKFAYDLWGDTVNVAQRMEATGIAGRVQVSEAVRASLAPRFAFLPRGEIEVKGKGLMNVWLVESEA